MKVLLAWGKTYTEKVEERFVLLLRFESFPKSKKVLHITLICVISSNVWYLLWVIFFWTVDQLRSVPVFLLTQLYEIWIKLFISNHHNTVKRYIQQNPWEICHWIFGHQRMFDRVCFDEQEVNSMMWPRLSPSWTPPLLL